MINLRKAFNCNLPNLDKFSCLIFGPYGSGKTHIQGDFLAWAKAQDKGPVAFINIAGQDGYASIAGYDLGEVGETVETPQDFKDALTDLQKKKTFALAVDGLEDLYRIVLVKELGELRYPDPKIDGDRSRMLYGQIAFKTKDLVLLARNAVPYVLFVCPVEKQALEEGGAKKLSPDLVGKVSGQAIGWFDLVGHLTMQVMGPGKVKRTLTVATNNQSEVRQRLINPIQHAIEIPEGKGGWVTIFGEVEKAMGRGAGA